jgi:thiaminase
MSSANTSMQTETLTYAQAMSNMNQLIFDINNNVSRHGQKDAHIYVVELYIACSHADPNALSFAMARPTVLALYNAVARKWTLFPEGFANSLLKTWNDGYPSYDFQARMEIFSASITDSQSSS